MSVTVTNRQGQKVDCGVLLALLFFDFFVGFFVVGLVL